MAINGKLKPVMPTTTASKRGNKLKQWPPIHRLSYSSGATAWQVACMVNGKRIRETFATSDKAATRAAEIRTQLINEGRSALSLDVQTRAEAARAVAKLTPHQATITEAVDYYLEHYLKFRAAPTVKTVVAEIIAQKNASGRRARTIRQFGFLCERFALNFGARRLSTIAPAEIQTWLTDEKIHGIKLGPVSRINYLVAIGNVFNYGVQHGYCDRNPVKLLDRPSRESADIKFLTVEQVISLLLHAEKHELVPYVAFGVFAGLRPEKELRALEWPKVSLPERTIRIDASLAKTRQRRVIEIGDALAAYLTPHTKKRGLVVPLSDQAFRTRWEKCRTDAGLIPWPHDVMRHTFATYHLAAFNDIGKLALQMGNSPQVIHSAYKGLVSKADAGRFFALRPADADDNKIVAFTANG